MQETYTIKEAAAFIGVSYETIRYYMRRGLLVGHREKPLAADNPKGHGVKWVFTASDLGRLLYVLTEKARSLD